MEIGLPTWAQGLTKLFFIQHHQGSHDLPNKEKNMKGNSYNSAWYVLYGRCPVEIREKGNMANSGSQGESDGGDNELAEI